jgi:RNA polymerase sigma-70 factor, ECF subfamily
LHTEDEDPGLSFEELVGKYHRKIFNLILRAINDTEEALDLTQETFLEAGRRLESFRLYPGRSSTHAWLCQIAINQCEKRFRQRHRGPGGASLS